MANNKNGNLGEILENGVVWGGYNNIVKRMDLNDSCWMSSGEFGKSQRDICDSLRFASDEDEAIEIANEMEEAFSENYGLY